MRCCNLDRIHRLFAKALQCSREVKFIKLWEQAERFMSVWARAMNYCYRNGIEVPKEQEAERKALEKAIRACGMEETSEAFFTWYFDEDNDCPFITMDYGGGERYAYPFTDEDPDGNQMDAGQSGQYGPEWGN